MSDNLLPDRLVNKAREVVDANRAAGRRIAIAESCTGGLVSAALTEIPGSSDVFEAGYVTYSNAAKVSNLRVSEEVVETFGSVSVATAWAMARGALAASDADVAVAITGIAGPGGATPGKPVGLVHFAVAARDGRIMHREMRFGAIGRTAVRQRSVVEALRMLMDLARGPKAQPKPRRAAAATRLRPRVTRSPRRHAVKRRTPRSPRG